MERTKLDGVTKTHNPTGRWFESSRAHGKRAYSTLARPTFGLFGAQNGEFRTHPPSCCSPFVASALRSGLEEEHPGHQRGGLLLKSREKVEYVSSAIHNRVVPRISLTTFAGTFAFRASEA